MNWRNLKDIHACIQKNLGMLRGQNSECVVGIPRSGMLAASIIALHLNLPLVDVYSFCRGDAWWRNTKTDARQYRRVLLVDDSVNGGNAMHAAMGELRTHRNDVRATRCAVYGRSNSIEAGYVDIVMEAVDGPRVFEWNLFKHRILKESVVDIDGVMCRDPRPEENDDGCRYLEFIKTVKPVHLPSRPLGWVCTTRLEKYRTQTEAWLKRNGVRYGALFMLNMPDARTRRQQGGRAVFKAQIYKRLSNAALFVESDARYAPEIARRSGKPVVCMETLELIQA